MRSTTLAELLLQRLDYHPDNNQLQKVRTARPLNRQLYQIIREAILSQLLPAGMQLPSTRALALELAMSRNTVSYAYEQLLAEGYLETRSSAGTFIADTAPEPQFGIDGQCISAFNGGGPVALSSRGAQLIARAGASSQQWGAFMPGVPDVTLFPNKIWARLQNRHWQRAVVPLRNYGQGGGYLPLREAIADYVRIARAVKCKGEQVIVTTGIHQSIDLITRLLGEPGDVTWIENPCYWGTRNVLASLGMGLVPIAVDGEGMQVPLDGLADRPKFVFTTPSHQYPLGTVMSLARRRNLLEFAAAKGAWIVEDDYDSEFRYSGRSLASLQGLDSHDRVLYMGTFSKTLFPGLRIGFVIVPQSLAGAFATGVDELYRGGQMLTQAALADFMAQGYFASHIRKMKMVYAERLKLLRAEIRGQFNSGAEILGDDAGLHLTLKLPDHCDDLAISREAQAAGIIARPLSAYYMDTEGLQRGLILGYACVANELIAPSFQTLALIIKRHLSRK